MASVQHGNVEISLDQKSSDVGVYSIPSTFLVSEDQLTEISNPVNLVPITVKRYPPKFIRFLDESLFDSIFDNSRGVKVNLFDNSMYRLPQSSSSRDAGLSQARSFYEKFTKEENFLVVLFYASPEGLFVPVFPETKNVLPVTIGPEHEKIYELLLGSYDVLEDGIHYSDFLPKDIENTIFRFNQAPEVTEFLEEKKPACLRKTKDLLVKIRKMKDEICSLDPVHTIRWKLSQMQISNLTASSSEIILSELEPEELFIESYKLSREYQILKNSLGLAISHTRRHAAGFYSNFIIGNDPMRLFSA
jgi:hypothetical protein